MKTVSWCVCVSMGRSWICIWEILGRQIVLRMDVDTTIEQEKEGDESGMSLVGEGMCTDGAASLEELRKHYE